MLKEKLDSLISESMKNKNSDRLSTFRLIKSEFTKFEKDNKNLTESDEMKILMKMAAQREDSIVQYTNANRIDLVNEEKAGLEIIREFIPKQPTDIELFEYTESVISDIINSGREVSMKSMKEIMSKVKEKYPMANGKILSSALKSYLN